MPQDRRRVVWFEGMMLDPHHFQQWDRYHRSTLEARLGSLHPFHFGLTALEVDRERLANGEFVVVRAAGAMPDGLVFDLPLDEEPPPPRNIQDYFPATEDRLGVFLSTPSERVDGGNYQLQNGSLRREARFRAETVLVSDENLGGDPREVEVARSAFNVRLSGEPLQEFTTLQIAEVRRGPSGTFVLSDEFVPPCLSLAGSTRLQSITRRLLELLATRSGTLMERYRSASRQREVSPDDLKTLGLLSVVNAFVPLLNHYEVNIDCHPEALYRTLLSLGGQLTAYLPDAGIDPRSFPTYDHADLTHSFNRLDGFLREMLGGATPTANYVQIPLTQQRENLFAASVEADLLQNAQLFLLAKSQEYGEEKIVAELPSMLRIASPETIDAVLRAYTTALKVEHTHRLPSALPVDAQANYFQLQKRGPFWEAIVSSGALAIFIPREFSAVELKLLAVRSP